MASMGAASAGADMGGGIGSGIGAQIGYFLSQGDRDSALRLLQNAADNYNNLRPNVSAEQATTDPQAKAYQLDAFSRLRDIYKNGGLDAQAKADQFATQTQANQNAQALQSSVRNSMAERGLASSGANFAAQRQAAQNQANQAAGQALQAQAAGEQRATGALTAGMQGANAYGQGQDAISAFNAGQRQKAQQSSFDNSLAKTDSQARAYDTEAGGYRQSAKDTQDEAAGMGGTLGGIIGTFAGLSDERMKTDVQRLPMEAVPGVPLATFRYKHAPELGHMLGVVAQDVEKVRPDAVLHDRNGIKYVDYGKLGLRR